MSTLAITCTVMLSFFTMLKSDKCTVQEEDVSWKRAEEGLPVGIYCGLYSMPSLQLANYSIHWYINGSEMIINKQNSSRIRQDDYMLWLLPALYQDSGSYACVARYRNSTQCYKSIVHVEVFSSSGALCFNKKLYHNQTIPVSTNSKLVCHYLGASGEVDDFSIYWYKDCKLLQSGRFVPFGEELLIKNVREDDKGKYQCRGSYSYLGHKYNFSRSILVSVTGNEWKRTEILYPRNNTIEAELGSNVFTQCNVSSFRNTFISISWRVNYTLVDFLFKGRIQEGIQKDYIVNGAWLSVVSLNITKLERADYNQWFVCHAGEVAAYISIQPPTKNFTGLAALVLLILIPILICLLLKMEIVLWYRKTCRSFCCKNDGKIYDAYVLYPKSDTPNHFALKVLPEVLEKQCGYNLFILGRNDLPGKGLPVFGPIHPVPLPKFGIMAAITQHEDFPWGKKAHGQASGGLHRNNYNCNISKNVFWTAVCFAVDDLWRCQDSRTVSLSRSSVELYSTRNCVRIVNQSEEEWYIKELKAEDTGKYTCVASFLHAQKIYNSTYTIRLTVKDAEEVTRSELLGSDHQVYKTEIEPNPDLPLHTFTTGILVAILFSFAAVVSVILCAVFRVDLVLLYRDITGKDETLGDIYKRSSTITEGEDGKVYDAFVSYLKESTPMCDEERKFVLDTLPKTLEEHFGYKLCIFERDILSGGAVVDDVQSFIDRSRRLIIVLSQNHTSDNVMVELEVGLHKALVERKIKVILIEHAPIQNFDFLPKSLELLSCHQVLKWKEEKSRPLNSKFWKKLRWMMPAKPCLRNKAAVSRPVHSATECERLWSCLYPKAWIQLAGGSQLAHALLLPSQVEAVQESLTLSPRLVSDKSQDLSPCHGRKTICFHSGFAGSALDNPGLEKFFVRWMGFLEIQIAHKCSAVKRNYKRTEHWKCLHKHLDSKYRAISNQKFVLSCDLPFEDPTFIFNSSHFSEDQMQWLWRPNNGEVKTLLRNATTNPAFQGNALWFNPITTQHSGTYICTNREKSPRCVNMFIVVQTETMANCSFNSMSPRYLLVKQGASIACPGKECYRDFPHSSVKWYKNGKKIKLQKIKRPSLQFQHDKIILRSVYAQDHGIYVCDYLLTDNNTQWKMRTVLNVTIITKDTVNPPKVLYPSNVTTLEVEVGQPLEFECKAQFGFELNTSSSIQWYRETSKRKLLVQRKWVHPNGLEGQTFRDIFNLTNVNDEDLNSRFICLAQNAVGNSTGIFKLRRKTGKALYLLLTLCCIIVALFGVVLAGMLAYWHWIDLVLFYRYYMAKDETVGDCKEYDAFVSYAKPVSPEAHHALYEEEQFALEFLPQVLENEYGYKLCLMERNILAGGGNILYGCTH
ncbi:hypothetical protein JRQ81_019230 [Phrynocephalus forsythii]|uniref:Uncharacterized protein n=1 Tax=Phrynocephalus forsythii TaxID=171643 RepID=A0A9Q1AXS5_9SAUR|nr:hypothetical protein JRQ81_019230 [Phrynocephalus forsythii]